MLLAWCVLLLQRCLGFSRIFSIGGIIVLVGADRVWREALGRRRSYVCIMGSLIYALLVYWVQGEGVYLLVCYRHVLYHGISKLMGNHVTTHTVVHFRRCRYGFILNMSIGSLRV